MSKEPIRPHQTILAWLVHIFTASGLLAGFMALLAARDHDWQEAAWWLLIALVIDGIDGTFARAVRIGEVLPHVSGKNIDFVVDFVNYAVVPAFMLYESDLISDYWNVIAVAAILLVSALYYGIEEMVSKDNYFLGFPVMWNMLVLYLIFILQLESVPNTIIVLFFAVLHFVPIKFAYPSQNSYAKVPTLVVTVVFIANLIVAIQTYPTPPLWCVLIGYATVLYYGILAVYDTYFRKLPTSE